MKKWLAKFIVGSGLLLSTSGIAWGATNPLIYFDNCDSYGTVEYMEDSHGNSITRSYYSIETSEFLGYKKWRSGVIVKDTLGVSCENDL